ncbi:MAG: polysaccharide pyruvyl transferase CsaB [Candidatus Eremiobacteraeota bacterium]|nr:polysaccharide pyruvyl transferase CsaB [Candidatus Eremiobacteraeota bacterium]
MRFLLSGYYGFGNLGDDALLEVIVTQLRTRYPYAEINVLSAQPETTAHELRVKATPRMDLGAVREAIARADVVLSGGGGLLQNATSLKSLLYYAGVLRSSVRASRKTMIFAQSIGPLDFWGKTLVREWCKGVSRATVRDARSATLLSGLLPGTPVDRTADPVFLYDAPEEDVDLTREGIGPESDPLVVVSVRKAQGFKDGIDVVARAVDRLSAVHGARVAFLPLGGAPDAEISTQIIRKCKSAPVLLPDAPLARAANIIRRSKAVIGMRLHALILAARYGVPFLTMPYDPKVAALSEDLAYPLDPLFVPGAAVKPAPAVTDALVDRLWSERDALSAHLLSRGAELRMLAARNFEVLDDLLGEQRRKP